MEQRLSYNRSNLPVVGALLVCLIALPAHGDEMAVVVNRQNSVNNISVAELQRIFVGEQRFWNTSKNPVTVIMLAPGSPGRDAALTLVFQMSEAEYKKYWIGRVNRGEAVSPPAEVFASGGLQGLVREIPGAIGIVKSSEVRPEVKVLKIDGHLPGEPGYGFRNKTRRNVNVTASNTTTN
jgi:ABC-type phosphate transport system substrate-binding protein